ncbi:MAG: phosphoesterase [candidate division KSB1 bacterium]|nr:phosphoesterase [candidate division KSB1 bacterium]
MSRSVQTERQSPLFPEHIKRAISRHNGANYYRCALQVNTPFQDSFKGFDSRHRRHSPAYQREFALALAKACKKAGINVIGLCDHNSVEYVETVRRELEQENITVFPGFEIASTEGLHLLCLFNPDAKVKDLDHLLTELGLPPKVRWPNGDGYVPRQSKLTFPQIIEHVQRNREGICIAAHIDRENGLLNECAKTTRVQYFTDPNLHAGQIAGRREDLTEFYRKVVDNELTHYRRQQPLALINGLDVYNLKDLSKPECSTWIKMSSPSVEGLWQAFLDPESRVRLLSEEPPTPHAELAAMAWQGGFWNGRMIHFNENLNCLIGGRGTGKSTIIESLRYVLDLAPIGDAARQTQEEILQQVLSENTRLSLLVRSPWPAPRYYLIERSDSQKPVVCDESGAVLQIHPAEILPGVEIFGQHEIAEIAKDRIKQYQLLQRFREPEKALALESKKRELQRELKANRSELLRTQNEIETLADKLSRLPAVEEKLKRYRELGIEAKLKEQANLTREEALLKNSREGFPSVKKALEQLRRVVAQNAERLDPAAWAELPNADLWEKLEEALENFHDKMQACLDEAGETIKETEAMLFEIAEAWQIRRHDQVGAPSKSGREFKTADGEAFLKLQREYEALAPLQKEAEALARHEEDLQAQRRQLLQAWEELKWNLFELDHAAAAEISEKLEGQVRARVAKEGNLTPLFDLLQELYGRKFIDNLANKINEEHPIAMADFVQHIRDGKKTLRDLYHFTESQAEKLINLPAEKIFELEELDLPAAVYLELNVAEKEQPPQWKPMNALSIGQKATAILLVLFLENDTPLVIDQPEDDLDNRFITDVIIPRLREGKRRRQFIFATHNANLPVLGDAELIVALEAASNSETATGAAEIKDDHLGAIDTLSVKSLVEQILEGGKEAFEKRRTKYGF